MPIQDLDLRMLYALEALVIERHVTRAAERLDISQSTMSMLLAKLRQLLDDEILMRGGEHLMPTERALQLLPRVRLAIETMERVLVPDAVFDPARASCTFRIIVIDYIDILLMPAVSRRLRADAPGVRLEVQLPNPHHYAEMLAAGELDLVLTNNWPAPAPLSHRRLFSDRFVALCAADHPALRGELDAAQFCALPHITIEPGTVQVYNAQIDAALQAMGLRRQVRMIKPSFLALPFVLEASDMVACVPVRLARRLKHMAKVEMFDIPLQLEAFDVRLMWHPRSEETPQNAWFRNLICECALSA